jgi:hypothetical protein
MFDSPWHVKVAFLLETNGSFEEFWDILVEMKEKGISQDQTYAYFIEIRNQTIIEKMRFMRSEYSNSWILFRDSVSPNRAFGNVARWYNLIYS